MSIKRLGWLLTLFGWTMVTVQAQSLSRKAISSASICGNHLMATIGQPANVQVLSSEPYQLRQGFQQALPTLSSRTPTTQPVAETKSFPNPYRDLLHFESENECTRIDMYNERGALLLQVYPQNPHQITLNGMSRFSPGMYYFILRGTDHQRIISLSHVN